MSILTATTASPSSRSKHFTLISSLRKRFHLRKSFFLRASHTLSSTRSIHFGEHSHPHDSEERSAIEKTNHRSQASKETKTLILISKTTIYLVSCISNINSKVYELFVCKKNFDRVAVHAVEIAVFGMFGACGELFVCFANETRQVDFSKTEK